MFYNSINDTELIHVLMLLKSHNYKYLSSQNISNSLCIHKTAIWRHVRTLRRLGYQIQTKPRIGYKLTKTTNKLLPWEILSGGGYDSSTELKTKYVGQYIHHFNKLDSTQKYAQRLAARPNYKHGSVVIAEQQLHGRGRLKRQWESPLGGIWLSIILGHNLDVSMLPFVPIAMGLAVSTAIEKSTKIQTRLKWPNDIIIDSKKVAGIIADASIQSNSVQNVVLGIGINFDVDTKHIQQTLLKTNLPPRYKITSIVSHNSNANKIRLVQTLFTEIEKIALQLEHKHTSAIIKKWIQKSSSIGKKVQIYVNNKKCNGTITGISKDDGALLVKMTSGKTQKVLADDPVYL